MRLWLWLTLEVVAVGLRRRVGAGKLLLPRGRIVIGGGLLLVRVCGDWRLELGRSWLGGAVGVIWVNVFTPAHGVVHGVVCHLAAGFGSLL